MAEHQPAPVIPAAERLATALRRNIEALERRRREEAAAAPLEQRVAASITDFTGSMLFV